MSIFSNLKVFTSQKKYDELSEMVAFGQKLRYFTDQNGPNEMNFDYFKIQK